MNPALGSIEVLFNVESTLSSFDQRRSIKDSKGTASANLRLKLQGSDALEQGRPRD